MKIDANQYKKAVQEASDLNEFTDQFMALLSRINGWEADQLVLPTNKKLEKIIDQLSEIEDDLIEITGREISRAQRAYRPAILTSNSTTIKKAS